MKYVDRHDLQTVCSSLCTLCKKCKKLRKVEKCIPILTAQNFQIYMQYWIPN